MISIIIPTFNASKYIIEAINCVLKQTYKNVECIVVDDGSTDNTSKLLKPLVSDNLIKYYYQENKGVSSARNLGIEQCKGEYVLFLDADDLLVNDALQYLINEIDQYDVIFGAWADFNNDDVKANTYNNYKGKNQLIKYLIHKPTISSALVKRPNIIKWDKSIKVWEVTDYFLNLILSNAKVTFTNKITTRIRQHNNPNRASIVQDHFNPLQTLTFLKRWKTNIKDKNFLDSEVEAVIDTEIANNIYTALRLREKPSLLKPFFSLINIENLKYATAYKKYGLLFFIKHFKSFNALLLFKNLNKLLGRV